MNMPDKNKPKDTGHIATLMNDNMDDGDEANVTVKGSCSEQRKLRSRDAARCRRGKETELFYDLARTLPLPRRVSTHLDKAAIMRVTLSVLRMHRLLHPGTESPKASEEVDDDDDDEDPADVLYTQALSGFIVVITAEGDIIYMTDNVSKHIGIPQLELLGQSVYDFVHPCDQEELRDLLTHPVCSKKLSGGQLRQMNFFLRMKSTLTSKGRTVNIKSASWKVFHCTGHMRALGDSSAALPVDTVMTLLCEPVPHPSSVDFPLDTHTFLTRHSMDMRFTHCEGRLGDLVGYEADDLIGRSAFEFYHAVDSVHVNKSLHTLLAKGQVSTSPYRFLASGGGFVWAETQATVLYNNKTSHAEAVVCLNFVLSAVEQSDVFFSSDQIRTGHRLKAEHLDKNTDAGESCESRSPPEILLPPAAKDKDAVAPLTGDFITLSFATPRSLSNIPEDPQDLCTPQLRQLLLPIFNHDSSSSSSSSLDPEPAHSNNGNVRDTNEVEKSFAFWPEDGDKMQDNMQHVMDGVDLDMLAPYISMDDDFQLSFFSAVPEANTDVNTEPPPELTAINRKRAHNSDEDVLSQLMAADDKRHKHDSDAASQENQLLLSHVLLGCLTESQSEEEPGTKGRSHLLTDRDPIFGGMRGLCDTTSLMMDIFKSEPPPDLSPMS
ncbi:hypoxia inducible factor 1 subunit alpha, like isoform X2 [Hippocampus zosterae]|uniref:hypoxia inducible factor 1 subunit alpha, like isoform X2 n=1 Tax=Hippocampus zosterae TaxID=109293 RepID=UPI00223D5679|nr:hypoxia inducible factor 1 subunit alpha, like isoform X2 [Hippocampus zosterae]